MKKLLQYTLKIESQSIWDSNPNPTSLIGITANETGCVVSHLKGYDIWYPALIEVLGTIFKEECMEAETLGLHTFLYEGRTEVRRLQLKSYVDSRDECASLRGGRIHEEHARRYGKVVFAVELAKTTDKFPDRELAMTWPILASQVKEYRRLCGGIPSRDDGYEYTIISKREITTE